MLATPENPLIDPNGPELYRCHRCGGEFRARPATLIVESGSISCPRCGHIYVKLLKSKIPDGY